MTTPAKFTFDLDLTKPVRKEKTFLQADLDEAVQDARQKAYEEGFLAGESSIQSQTNQQIAQAAENILTQSTRFIEQYDTLTRTHLTLATKLAATVGHKLAKNLIAQSPDVEIMALLEECLSSLGTTPHLVMRCHESLSAAIEPMAQKIITQSGFEGRLIVMGEPDIALGDCKIEWADGGLARNLDRMEHDVAQKIDHFTASKGVAQLPEQLKIDEQTIEQGADDTALIAQETHEPETQKQPYGPYAQDAHHMKTQHLENLKQDLPAMPKDDEYIGEEK